MVTLGFFPPRVKLQLLKRAAYKSVVDAKARRCSLGMNLASIFTVVCRVMLTVTAKLTEKTKTVPDRDFKSESFGVFLLTYLSSSQRVFLLLF